jgi:hypothetical protein
MVNIDVSCSVAGPLRIDSKSKQASTRIDRLLFEECYDWAVSFDVLSLDTCQLTVSLAILSPTELIPDMKPQGAVPLPTTASALLPGVAPVTPQIDLNEAEMAELTALSKSNQHFTLAPITTTIPYTVPITETLLPIKYSVAQFLWQWNGFPASFFVDAQATREVSLTSLLTALCSSSFAQSTCKRYGNDHYFQLGLSSVSWFGDQVCLVIVGSLSAQNLWELRLEGRSSCVQALAAFHNVIEQWLSHCTGEAIVCIIRSGTVRRESVCQQLN